MILGIDYVLRDDIKGIETDTIPIELKTGPYTGVVYRYIAVAFKQETKETPPTIAFKFELIDTKKFKKKLLEKDKLFKEHIGLILNSLILDVTDIHAPEKVDE